MGIFYVNGECVIAYEKRTIIYKGIEYNRDDMYAIIKENTYTICKVSRVKLDDATHPGEQRILLQNINNPSDFIWLTGNSEIESKITKLVAIPKVPQEKPVYDHPNAMSIGNGVLLYIVVMIGGTIFNERWIIYIVATIWFLCWIAKKPKFKD